MKRVLVLSLLLGACSGGETVHEQTYATSSALLNSGTVPYPVKVKNGLPEIDPVTGKVVPAWDGSVVDLLAADAWAQCAANSQLGALAPNDKYIAYLETKISSMTCTPPPMDGAPPPMPTLPTKAGAWAKQRTDARCNVDPSTGSPKALKMTSATLHAIPAMGASYEPARANAELEVHAAEVNLCMAQRLREYSSSGDALILDGADQRQLLEVTRERVQVAMLQYAAMGVIVAQNSGVPSAPLQARQVLPVISQWSRQSSATTAMTELGNDFASAVQLHAVVSRELAELLWRSASAKLPRGGNARTTGEEIWGYGSWRYRMMTALYGGDPLFEANASHNPSPWTHFAKKTTPVAPLMPWPGWNLDAPTLAATDTRSPEVATLLALARRADVLDLQVGIGTNYPDQWIGLPHEYWSWNRIYRAVEATIRVADCELVGTATCDFQTILAALPDATNSFEQYLLWQRHRVHPNHAMTLVRALAEQMPKIRFSKPGNVPVKHQPGAVRLLGPETQLLTGAAVQAKLGPGVIGDWYHIDPKSSFAELDLPDIAPLYTRHTGHRIPTTPEPMNGSAVQGLMVRMTDNESMRVLGAISALHATREGLRAAMVGYGATNTGYFARASTMLELIDGAIGMPSVAFRPSQVVMSIMDNCWNGAPGWTACESMVQKTNTSGVPEWEVDVTLPSDHAFAASGVRLVAIDSGMLATQLAERPTAKSFLPSNNTIATLVADAVSKGRAFDPSTSSSWSRPGLPTLALRRFVLNLPAGDYAFVLEKTGTTPSYFGLGEAVALRTFSFNATPTGGSTQVVAHRPIDGQYLAYEGLLGTMVRQAWAGERDNWSRPAYDGYGLPVRWMPPTDPTLFGGSSGDSAVSHNLRSARQAADEATNAVKYAIDELLREQTDEATLAAAQKKAAGIARLEERSLCGDASPLCNVSSAKLVPSTPNTVTCPASPPALVSIEGVSVSTIGAGYMATCNGIKNMTSRILGAAAGPFEVGSAVAAARYQKSPPDFAAYRGGALQSIYVEQWQALRRVENEAQETNAVASAVWANIDVAYRQSAFSKYKAMMTCTRDVIIGALEGITVSAGFLCAEVSYNPAPALRALAACQDALAEQKLMGKSELTAAIREGVARLSARMTALAEAVGALQQAAVKGQRALHETKLAKARANLEVALTASTQVTKFGMYRRYHSYDMWRARALLESARRFAVAARRSIEARYVVDLSTINGAEPYVAAPATWADEIYEYDLDAPAAVGLAAIPSQQGGIYPNRISDYIGNLERFVQGYAVARPTSTVKRDEEVLSLPGPEDRTLLPDGISILSPSAARWEYFCPATSDWRGHPGTGQRPVTGTIADACKPQSTAPPTRARVVFGLDPWGRVNGDFAREPYAKRHNARWVRLAVNLVGTGINDCSKALDPPSCYTQPFVRYDLSHSGPAWVTSYEQEWRVLGVPFGRIEGAKALAAEQWLDPIGNGFGRPHVEAVARDEMIERPFGGAYAVDLALAPEVRPERIESIQVLLQSSYWVKQQ